MCSPTPPTPVLSHTQVILYSTVMGSIPTHRPCSHTYCPHTYISALSHTQVILYSTVMGSIGALYPFNSREDIDFFVHLEMHMRQEAQPLCGRDHMAFRSAYFPTKDVVDGDLCAQYPTVS